MSFLLCKDWWEQAGYGRQPMEQLRIEFDGGSIRGSGSDIIGLFTLTGTIEDGKVAILKQYLGQHSVDYLGTYGWRRDHARHVADRLVCWQVDDQSCRSRRRNR